LVDLAQKGDFSGVDEASLGLDANPEKVLVAAFNLGPSFGRRFDNRFIYVNSQPIHLSPDVVFDLQAGCRCEPSSEGRDRDRDGDGGRDRDGDRRQGQEAGSIDNAPNSPPNCGQKLWPKRYFAWISKAFMKS